MFRQWINPNRAVQYLAWQRINDIKGDPLIGENIMMGAAFIGGGKKSEDIEFQKQLAIGRALWLASEKGFWKRHLEDESFWDNYPDAFQRNVPLSELHQQVVFLRSLLNIFPDISKMPQYVVKTLKKASIKGHP